MNKLSGNTLDIVQHNIGNLKQLFPEVVTDGKINFDKLKLILGENIETENEKYEFTWNGKTSAIKVAQTPSLGTLLPDKESSKNWDNTENIYIEGDNLEVLKLLQKSYFGKVKMIYIDPPYNTGKDFVYKDNFHESIQNYREQTKQTTNVNVETNGRFHTDWLNMVYPRLRLARNLLANDGIIFISIDDNEFVNLRRVCDEIFGESNFYCTFVWQRRSGSMDSVDNVSADHEYILCYGKVKDRLNGIERTFARYSNPDNDPRGPWISDNLSAGKPGGDVYYAIKDPNTGNEFFPPKGRYWPYSRETMKRKIEEGRILFPANPSGRPMLKRFQNEAKNLSVPVSTLLKNYTDKDIPNNSLVYALNTKGTSELQELFNDKVFSYPKSTILIKSLLSQVNDNEGIILDFFSGSSTTADAIMQMNAEDGGQRKFIMVQLPEKIDENSEAFKAGFNNICEIGKERIRRAGEKIVKESGKNDLDIGFRVFKLDTSNIKQWNSENETVIGLLESLESNIVQGRTNEDLLFEILIKIGLPLTSPIERINVNGKIIYDVSFGSVLLCLEDDITLDVVQEMLSYVSDDIETKVIFKEIGFRDDTTKTNAIQTLKKHGIKEENIRSV